MPVEVLSIGPLIKMLANVVYALPAVNVTLYTDAAAPTLALSNGGGTTPPTFGAGTAVTLTAGAASLSGGFIKATADTIVTLKRD